MSTFLQQLINGLSLGSIYALLALGYTMVYGCTDLKKIPKNTRLNDGKIRYEAEDGS